MNKDYQFLIGQRFSVGGDIYVVRDLTPGDDRTYVEAQLPENEDSQRTFSLKDVIEWLVVDEEIELFNPNYLAAR